MYGKTDKFLRTVVCSMQIEEQVVEKLKKLHYTVTTAESCTGGLLAGTILNVSGASTVYNEGYITYSNEAKKRILGVSSETLYRHGAVSEETAREMAIGVAKVAKADIGLSTTGIAGPTGGTKDKPVGLIYVACSILGKVSVKKLQLNGTREENRNEAVRKTLEMLNEILGNS